MATQLTEFQFQEATLLSDGKTPIPAGTVVTYTIQVDTVNPPVKAYTVPVAQISAAVGGLVTVTFPQLGFAPIPGTTYYADVVASDNAISSAPTGVQSFVFALAPQTPTGFKVG